jgi:hypothetical protein
MKVYLDGRELTEEQLAEETKKAKEQKKRVVLAESITDESGMVTQERKYVTKLVLQD